MTMLSATKDFATEWETLLRPAEGQEGDPLSIPIMPERFPYVARSRGVVIDSIEWVFIGDPNALSLPTPVTLMTPQGSSTLTFSNVDDLLTATLDSTDSALPLTLDDTTGAWSLELPPDAIVDPDAVDDLWILVRYHVVTPPPAA